MPPQVSGFALAVAWFLAGLLFGALLNEYFEHKFYHLGQNDDGYKIKYQNEAGDPLIIEDKRFLGKSSPLFHLPKT